MSPLEEFDRRIRETIEAIPPAIRLGLIRVLEEPEEERAPASGRSTGRSGCRSWPNCSSTSRRTRPFGVSCWPNRGGWRVED